MDKQKKERLILLIAVVIFAIMMPQLVFKKKTEFKVLPPALTPPGVVTEQGQARKVAEPPPVETVQAEDAANDPFEIPANVLEKLNMAKYRESPEGETGESEDIAGINLQGFAWGGDAPIAFINDKTYKKGDMVGDAQILDIDKKGVFFLYGGRTVLMRVKK